MYGPEVGEGGPEELEPMDDGETIWLVESRATLCSGMDRCCSCENCGFR